MLAMPESVTLSPLGHTWLVDFDGTVVMHNGHLAGGDRLLPGAKEFWAQIPPQDIIIILSARTAEERDESLGILRRNGLRFDYDIFGLPHGERVLINDAKPSGLSTAIALCTVRDRGLVDLRVEIDDSL